MMRIRSLLAGGAMLLTASLLLARTHPFGNAELYRPTRPVPIMQSTNVPQSVRDTLQTKCADCHSMQTRMPAYGKLAPMSWLMERDILHARTAMNLSQWDSYSLDDQDAFKAKMLSEVKSGKMPLPQYRVIHWRSIITASDVEALASWANQNSSVSSAQPDLPADTLRGKDVFQRRCTGCHSLDENREGPRLRGVYGRVSGSVPDFSYSTALKKAPIHWNGDSLERWLTDPDAFVPGNDMEFHVAKPQERADLIRFLKDLGPVQP